MSEIICFYNYASGDEKSTGYFMLESNVELNDFKQLLIQSNIMTADQVLLDSNNQQLESDEKFASMKQFAETNDTPISITIASRTESNEAVADSFEVEPAFVLSEDEPFGPLSKQILTSFKIDHTNVTQLEDIINAIPFPFSMMARSQLANIRERPEVIEQVVSYLAPELAVEASPLVAEVKHTFAYFDRKERERQEKERQNKEEREVELTRQELARQQQECELEMARQEKEQRERQEQVNEREFIGSVKEEVKVREVKHVRHHAICDNCQAFIYGIRYKCLHCSDYDLCSACEEINTNQSFHDESHVFAKIHTPTSTLPPSSRVPGRMAACHAMRSMRQNRIATLEASVEELKLAVAALSENKM